MEFRIVITNKDVNVIGTTFNMSPDSIFRQTNLFETRESANQKWDNLKDATSFRTNSSDGFQSSSSTACLASSVKSMILIDTDGIVYNKIGIIYSDGRFTTY